MNIGSINSGIRKWKIPSFLLNKYVFVLFVFSVWMMFFDQNNFFVQLSRFRTLKEEQNKITYYKQETVKTKQQLSELLSDQQSLEKFAREKYYMKKPDEDVFVIVQH